MPKAATNSSEGGLEVPKAPEIGSSHGYFPVAVFIAFVLVIYGAVTIFQPNSPPLIKDGPPLPAPLPFTGQVAGVGAPPTGGTRPEATTVELLARMARNYEGKTVVVEGILGHRTTIGYGWNLVFDLFDGNGNSVRLAGINQSIDTRPKYSVVGLVRKAASGFEIEVERIDKIS